MLNVILTGNKIATTQHLAKFKERGVVKYDLLLSIPSGERMPALAKDPDTRFMLLTALTASLKSAFSNMNLKMGMNEDQVIDLADCIIDQSEEDNLSLEDVLLFLQKMLIGDTASGKDGKIFDRMDIPKFFELFEVYRQARHEELLNKRYEQNAQYKIAGSSGTRSSEMKENVDPKTFLELLKVVNDEKYGL